MKDAFTLKCGHANKFMRLVWWVLELLPIGIRMENKEGKWQNFHTPNLGRSRYVPEYVSLHWSVYWRIKFDRRYRPDNMPEYVRQLFQDLEGIDLKVIKFQINMISKIIATGVKSMGAFLIMRKGRNSTWVKKQVILQRHTIQDYLTVNTPN